MSPLVPVSAPQLAGPPGPPAHLFLDIETSQLDPLLMGACVLEVAWIVTDASLRVICERSVIVRPSASATYSAWSAQNLHPDLLAPPSPDDARPVWGAVVRQLASAMRSWGAAPYRLCGWSPHFDLGWLRREAQLAPMLSHRVTDCSTLSQLDGAWSPWPVERSGEAAHRALDDCRSALDYLRRWRAAIYGDI